MVELVGVHALDDGDVVDHFGQVRQHLRKLGARLAVSGEPETRGQQPGVGADEGVPLVLDDLGGNRLAVVLASSGL